MKKFKNEYEYLVHLIKCALQDKQPVELPKNLSFDKVFEYGKEHEVANIAFVSVQKLHKKPEDDLYVKWKTVYAFSIQRHANQMNARKEIVDALKEAEIRHVEVQGTIMKTLYPYPEWRMMSDIDFIIDKENLESAEAVMKKLGYHTENPNGVEIDAYGKNGIAVELHSDFFDPKSICHGTISDVFSFSTQIDDTYSYRASDTIFYSYNLLHCVKHYLQRGAGIRRIMDMYILRKRLSDRVDKEYIDKIISGSGYKATVDEIFAIVDKWFYDIKNEADLSKTEEHIYLSNNHGSMQIQLKNEYYRANTKNKRFFKVRKYRNLIFPSKDDMYRSYPLCKSKKYPIVVCWLYRWFSVLTNPKKRKNATRLLSEIGKTKVK